jgi:hypothetical protein
MLLGVVTLNAIARGVVAVSRLILDGGPRRHS